jgi:predicted nucleic acid-binding protein
MSATVDANVLIYASNTSDPLHEAAVTIVRRLADGPEVVFLFWPTLMAYLRIVTHAAILPRPLAPRDAMRNVESLLGRTHVRAPGESDGVLADLPYGCRRSPSGERRPQCTSRGPDAAAWGPAHLHP